MEVYLERDWEMIFSIGSLLRDRDICFAFNDVNHIWRDFVWFSQWSWMFFRNTTQVDLPWKKAKILLHSENEEIEFLKESSLTFPSPSSRALSALVISMETEQKCTVFWIHFRRWIARVTFSQRVISKRKTTKDFLKLVYHFLSVTWSYRYCFV